MITKAKGTNDIFGLEGKKIRYVERVFENIMHKYNAEYIKTPIFESSELFHRGVGETTDIVSKETYDFKDRGNRSITLRPEGTAGIVRSFIENKMYVDNNLSKLWYFGPMFRYERPQAGRYREFYQAGIEIIGSNSPMADVEAISIMVDFFKQLGLKGIKVNINSLGDFESRSIYLDALKKHFKSDINNMCLDCQTRYEKNPLRILDCKVDHNRDIMKNAPKLIDYLNEFSKQHFDEVIINLNELNIDYVINEKLVRGLDYYTHTVFEIEASIKGFGSQNVLGGGGRYDNLIQNLSGPDTPAVGFALGIERLILALDYEKCEFNIKEGIDAYIFGIGNLGINKSLFIAKKLRDNNYSCEIDMFNKNIKANFKQADKYKAAYVIIIGEDEIKNDYLTIKNNRTKDEYHIESSQIIAFFKDTKKEIQND